jgi:type II secretory pathway component PulF
MGPVVLVLVLLLLVASVLVRSVRAHTEIEVRAQVVELMARALARGRPLAPLIGRLVPELPRRLGAALEPAHEALENGAPLADALQAAGAPLFPAPWPEVVRATEGDGRLAGVLQAEARQEARQGRFLERLLVTLVYPAVLAFGAVVVHGLFAWTRVDGHGYIRATSGFDGVEVAIASALVAALLVWRVRRLPRGLRLRFAGAHARARILRVLSGLLDAGVPLHVALERVRGLAPSRALRQVIATAAIRAAGGAPACEVLAGLEPRRRQAARIRSATAHSLVERLRSVAAHLEQRARARERGVLAGIQPASVVVFGAVVLFGFAAFMHYVVNLAAAARPMPW